jgi:redox-sensitive bicupin YhaK (pirin superfamily)
MHHDDKLTRRDVLAAGLATLVPGCGTPATGAPPAVSGSETSMTDNAVLSIKPLGFVWDTADPFLFCVHHDDAYPAGNERLGPAASLAGRNIGQDFEGKDGWRMYHGDEIPGFPQHPHRGFETVTVVRRGFIDHSDSLGATARFGGGDAQWLTAGAGIVHSEMFPLLDKNGPNPLELFQIWLNLPRASKFAEPHFSMLWREGIPTRKEVDADGKTTEVTIIAGQLADTRAPAPPPKSWAADPSSDIAIWTIKMEPGARWTLPPAAKGSNRTLYYFRGSRLTVGGRALSGRVGVALKPDVAVELHNGDEPAELLLLQGRPIGEPVVQHGPFVMNTHAEIQQAFADYRRTRFGGWPWTSDGPAHPHGEGRFALHADGRKEHLG